MSQRLSELSLPGPTRCGRCSEILPDETLTYCPSCGIPFSKVPPTQSYLRFEDRPLSSRAALKNLARPVMAGAFFFVSLFFLTSLLDSLRYENGEARVSDERSLSFYFMDVPEYPPLSSLQKHESLAIGLQAFADHFGFAPRNFHVYDNLLPEGLEDFWKADQLPTQLSIWEKRIFPFYQQTWIENPRGPLPVLITNIPIFVNDEATQIETRHLPQSRLISGLAHPGFVVLSTFRLLTKDPRFEKDRFLVKDDLEAARLLGEYLLAHELGHALLGLNDYIEEKSSPKPTAAAVRRPASLTHQPVCLMHTDPLGGFGAWEAIRRRPLATPTQCPEYSTALSAHAHRALALEALKKHNYSEASQHLDLAIDEARQSLLPWVAQYWSGQKDYFLSLKSRWRNRLLMIQSSHD